MTLGMLYCFCNLRWCTINACEAIGIQSSLYILSSEGLGRAGFSLNSYPGRRIQTSILEPLNYYFDLFPLIGLLAVSSEVFSYNRNISGLDFSFCIVSVGEEKT